MGYQRNITVDDCGYIYIYIMGYTRIYNFHLSMVGKPSIYGDIGGTDLLIICYRLGICHQTKWDISRSYKNLRVDPTALSISCLSTRRR